MDKKASILTENHFLSFLEQFQHANKFWIAYSGGMDSSVLLHLFFLNKEKIEHAIEVIYVNHGLQEEANSWGEFCQQQCEKYGFPFTQLEIEEDCPKGESVEAWARDNRYKLIESLSNENDALFTGHHLDDQIETFFLQAFRGAGTRGLSSMPLISKKKKYIHARPLLNCSRKELEGYAIGQNLIWQNDASNRDSRFDRNYFRHEIAPLIENRWPAYRDTINRLIDNQQESSTLLNELAVTDINNALSENAINLDAVKSLSVARQKNLLFVWLQQLGFQTPGSSQMERVISDVINSDPEKSPCVNWAYVEIRRYKNYLYALKATTDFNNESEFVWKPNTVLNLYEETLSATEEKGIGLSKEKLKEEQLVVRFRQGGEKIKPANASHSKTIKQLFQEKSVLPWYRDKVPLIYVNDELAVIPGFCVDEKYAAKNDEISWDINWSGHNRAIQL